MSEFVLLYVGVALGASGLGVLAWRRREMLVAWPYALLMGSIAAWAGGYALEIVSPTMDSKVFWLQIQMIGIVSVPVLWLIFAGRCARSKPEPLPLAILLMGVPLITLGLVATNNSLFWRVAPANPADIVWGVQVDPGPWFWVQTLFSNACLIGGGLLLIREIIRPPTQILRAGMILLGVLAPWLGNFASLWFTNQFPFDWAPLSFVLSGACFAWVVFGSRRIGRAR